MILDIAHQDRLRSLSSDTGNTLAELYAHSFRNIVGITEAKADSQVLRLLIDQKNGKYFVINDFADQFRHPAQGGIEIERGIHHVCDFEQKRFDFDLRLGLSQRHVQALNDISDPRPLPIEAVGDVYCKYSEG